MFLLKLFDENSNWYKGNIHTHSNLSDGRYSIEESINTYKNNGYDFLAITDHRKYFEGYEKNDFVVLGGAEYHINDFERKKAYHILGIDMDKGFSMDDTWHPQDMIDAIKEQNGMAVIAHPFWSLLTHQDITSLKSYDGIEIWNTVSETNSARGDSTDYIDVIAAGGKLPLIFANDDTHFYEKDLFGGYIVVNSPILDTKNIMENILEGKFYCSQGPEIKQITIDGNTVYVHTSPVKQVNFMTDLFYCDDRIYCDNDNDIDKAVYTIKPNENYLRIECVDKYGKKAWSQLIRLNK